MIFADDVHVWIAVTDQCQQPALIKQYQSLLDQSERQRYKRFRFDRHRQGYLIAHALLRFCLSHYGTQQPSEWRFSKNDYGRPEIWMDDGTPPLRFNLSHTDGLAACAITRTATVGVDVEYTARSGDLTEIATLSFAVEELKQLQSLEGKAWRDRFFDLWTLKEAYVKARGMGLALPLQQFAFTFTENNLIQFNSPRLKFNLKPSSKPDQSWWFGLASPTPNHRLSIAVCRPGPLALRVQQVIPGQAAQPLNIPVVTN